MALGKNRLRIFCKGLGNFWVRKLEPSEDATFSDAGHFKSAIVRPLMEMEKIFNDRGKVVNTLPKTETFDMVTELLQSSKDEMDLLRNAKLQVHTVRLYGLTVDNVFQYWCVPKGRIDPNFSVDYKPGERTLPCKVDALTQDPGYDVPLYYLFEGAAELTIDKLVLWLDPSLDLNTETVRVLDISGYEKHGTLDSGYASIWQQTTTPKEFLRFDGAANQCDLGNNFNDDGSADFIIEFWVRIQGADAGQEEIFGKKTLYSNNSAGFACVRTTANKIAFKLSDGSASATITSSNSVLQNVWKHVAIAIDRNGNGQIYINGAADGAAVSVASINTGTNALSFFLGRDSTNFGNVDMGSVRVHTYGAGNLPASIATIVANHFTAERANYGV